MYDYKSFTEELPEVNPHKKRRFAEPDEEPLLLSKQTRRVVPTKSSKKKSQSGKHFSAAALLFIYIPFICTINYLHCHQAFQNERDELGRVL